VPDRAWFYRALTAGWFSRQEVQRPTGYFLHTDERSSVTMAACRYLDALPIFTTEVLENRTTRNRTKNRRPNYIARVFLWTS